MKKFIIAVCVLAALCFAAYTAYYRFGVNLTVSPDRPVETFTRTDGQTILLERNGVYEPFEIRGVDMGAGIPGHWATDFAVDYDTYLRWFAQIQELGANTIRVYTIHHDAFYNAFYDYNHGREEPLYLLHGVWVNDYMQFSHRDGYDEEILWTLQEDCRTLSDILHGNRDLYLGRGLGSGRYRKDVSEWVIGYLIGVEWESSLVIYTNQKSEARRSYQGTYLYTAPEATAFEALLCQVGDSLIAYETRRYGQQRLVAFSNWPTTDPFVYPAAVTGYRYKLACVDVEHVLATENYRSGMFASYHVYPYFPDYLEIMAEAAQYSDEELDRRMGKETRASMEYRISKLQGVPIEDCLRPEDYYDSQGRYNTYIAYLRALARHHTLPVVITEYGVTTGRGMAQRDVNTGRNQGHMSEQEHGQALVDCYRDIMDAGCAGSCVFTWQDEWFKRTWNTMYAVDLDNTAYWSDCQTNEQYFGLLAFDPGEERSVCYVDGDISEWTEEDRVASSGDLELSMKYDEKYLYFLVKKPGLQPENDTIYIPLDVTPKSGSTYCQNYRVGFERAADFLVVIRGEDQSRVVVQKRYEVLAAVYGAEYYADDYYINNPDRHTPEFERIKLPLVLTEVLPDRDQKGAGGVSYETGKLRHGNGNPDSEDFDSLADFIFAGDYVELRLPWQLLNFSNPSEMEVHDDYYQNYGIENLSIREIYAGVGSRENRGTRIPMEAVPLKGWGRNPTSHERLKRSYYILRDYWASLDGES